MTTAARWSGRLLVVASLSMWLGWIGWRISSPALGIVGVVVLAAELAAITVAVVLSAALWNQPARVVTGVERAASLPETFATVVGIDVPASAGSRVGQDDTGEVAWARHATRSLRCALDRSGGAADLRSLAWSLVAMEGMRRLVTVGLVIVVLLSGRFPFADPPPALLVALVASQALLALGHFLLSGGAVRPGARLRWSMASVGAGFGDGTSRTGLPIRWTATLATMVGLNLAVSLRGVSDRWTHGLGAMDHDERVVTMLAAAWLVAWGAAALRTLPRPELGYYGATRRLEETSTRRLALGATFTVAAIGMVAGLLPGGVPT